MDLANNLTTNLAKVSSWWNKDSDGESLNQLSDNQILHIANNINVVLNDSKLTNVQFDTTLPELVMVGTQSSGKSSVLNGIIGMDILPTDSKIATRVPLRIIMNKGEQGSNGWVDFNNGEEKINISVPRPLPEEVTQIRKFIQQKTIELAGDNMNISSTPILLQIYSPHVPNLSLVDLPGLTMVACTDKGQPEDIKQRIEKLVISYIQNPKTIIITVMQARADLETDLGLALVKSHDKDGSRTIGVLTKPDLMNNDTHVGYYITNQISKNLMLTHGYYLVKNRNKVESQQADIIKGFELEKNYFNNHPEYKKNKYKDRIGIPKLTNNLNKILVSSITELIPSAMTEIVALETKINHKLEQMGKMPVSKEEQIAVLNKYASKFAHRLIDSIESRGTMQNTGKSIKDIFIDYRTKLNTIKPFSNTTVYNETYFKDIISSFEGNHMSFHIPPIQVLEACMTDEKLRPILSFKSSSLTCVDEICEAIIDLIKNLMQLDEFSQFPPLSSFVMAEIIDHIVSPLKIKAKAEIVNILAIEESYIWTDDDNFAVALRETTKKSDFDIETITNLLNSYFTAVKHIIAHIIPKTIMEIIIRNIEKDVLPHLFHILVNEDKIQYLQEDLEVDEKRKYYSELRVRIEKIKKLFSKNYIV